MKFPKPLFLEVEDTNERDRLQKAYQAAVVKEWQKANPGRTW